MARRETPTADPTAAHPEFDRFAEVMVILRQDCPWDAEQTHQSLVQYLVEETMETVEAIEAGSVEDLKEELGDLLLQVLFHATIARENEAFDIDEVARTVADKLIVRHPYIFASEEMPDQLEDTWEQRKRRLKGRTSALEGIPHQLSAMHRGAKVLKRAASHDVDLTDGPGGQELARAGLDLPQDPITSEEVGRQVLALVSRAHASGIDPEQATRAAVRGLEQAVAAGEGVRDPQA